MLDYIPAQLRVKVIRRPRYGCRACEGAVTQAPAPERPITGGLATEALLAAFVGWGGAMPQACSAHRWRYADSLPPAEGLRTWSPELGLGLCGDWLSAGKVEGAWLSGRSLAAQVLAKRM